MKKIIILSLCLLSLAVAHSQTPNEYALEIWSAEVFNKDGFDFIELDIFNNGSKMDNPTIQIMHDEVLIGKSEKDKTNTILLSQSIHKCEFPIRLPNNYSGKKIKLEVVIEHESYKLAKKVKVKIDK